MLNLAGSAYDYGQVLYAVLEECEHQRRALPPKQTAARLEEIARAKLAEIHRPYRECGGTEPYWAELSREVLATALPQYIEAALEKNRLERAAYDLWRRGDLVARGLYALGGLVLGGIMVALPFVPIWKDSFAFALACCGLFYPDLKRLFLDFRHTRLLNRLISQADRYQRSRQRHYVSEQEMDSEIEQALQAPFHHAGSDERAPRGGEPQHHLEPGPEHPPAPHQARPEPHPHGEPEPPRQPEPPSDPPPPLKFPQR